MRRIKSLLIILLLMASFMRVEGMGKREKLRALGDYSVLLNTTLQNQHYWDLLSQNLSDYSLKVEYQFIIRQDESVCDSTNFFHHYDRPDKVAECHYAISDFIDPDPYCKVVNLKVGVSGDSFMVRNLLPDQLYRFVWYLVDNSGNKIKGTTTSGAVCTIEDKPMFPPTAYMDSFSMTDNRVRIFWKPPSHVFLGGSSPRIGISCYHEYKLDDEPHTKNIINQTISVDQDSFLIENRDESAPLSCYLNSLNDLGQSNHSIVRIPSLHNIVKPRADFKIQDILINNNHYLAKWSNLISPAYHSQGLYRLYSCVHRSEGKWKNWRGPCELGLMKQVRGNELLMEFYPDGMRGVRPRFGISYSTHEHPHGFMSTGILWYDCPRELNRFNVIKQTISIRKVTTNVSESSVHVTWMLKDCPSFSLFIKSYDVEYCTLESIDLPTKARFKSSSAQLATSYCKTMNIVSGLIREVTIHNLNRDRWYSIRVNYFTEFGQGPWSRKRLISIDEPVVSAIIINTIWILSFTCMILLLGFGPTRRFICNSCKYFMRR